MCLGLLMSQIYMFRNYCDVHTLLPDRIWLLLLALALVLLPTLSVSTVDFMSAIR